MKNTFDTVEIQQLDDARSLAQFLNVSVACIRKYTRLTNMPRLRVGRAVRFHRQEVLNWLEARQQKASVK
jgi:excisionase family DNA binding protein